ncbi:MAG TPA: hypothetical protein VGG74_29075 [Kofleriaceae bacterium]|jgi:hypothetical protein
MEAQRKSPRFWVAVQPSIVRLYKVAGLVALTAILIGLLGFLVVNVFYFFDHSWVRPVVLSPTSKQVVDASTQLADAQLRANQLQTEQVEVTAELAEIDRAVATDEKVIAELAGVDSKKSPDVWVTLERTKLDKDDQNGKRAPLKARLEGLAPQIKAQDDLVTRLDASPYLRASKNKVVLAFVPYTNDHVKLGTKLYSCAWGLVMCSRVGKITATIDGEVTNTHPHDDSIQRGTMVEIELTNPTAEGEAVLFAGGKPLWLF